MSRVADPSKAKLLYSALPQMSVLTGDSGLADLGVTVYDGSRPVVNVLSLALS